MSDQPKSFQCRHVFTEGRRCGSPCLRDQDFCYYHHTSRKPVEQPAKRRARRNAFHLPFPEDRAAVQLSIGEVLRRIAANELDVRRAGLLLYGLQIAQCNLPRHGEGAAAAAKGGKRTEPKPQPYVEEVVLHPQHGLLALPAECGKANSEKNLYEILTERWDREQREEEEAELAKKPATVITLQASAPNSASPETRLNTSCKKARVLHASRLERLARLRSKLQPSRKRRNRAPIAAVKAPFRTLKYKSKPSRMKTLSNNRRGRGRELKAPLLSQRPLTPILHRSAVIA